MFCLSQAPRVLFMRGVSSINVMILGGRGRGQILKEGCLIEDVGT